MQQRAWSREHGAKRSGEAQSSKIKAERLFAN
jgi:hypothetical protein